MSASRRRPPPVVRPFEGRRLVAVLDVEAAPPAKRRAKPAVREAAPRPPLGRPAPPVRASREAAAAKDSQSRFEARARAERRAARWRAARRASLAAIPVGLAAAVFFSPVFAVREGQIEVRGIAGVVTAEEVTAALAPAVGVPLARLDLGDLTAGVEEIRGVKSASMSREWPTGLRVSIEPRLPVAAVRDGGRYVLLDVEGVQLAAVAQPPEGTPEVDVPLSDSDARTLRTVLDVLNTIPAPLAARISSIGAETRDTVQFTLAGGEHVIWGDASQSALKAAALDILLKTPAVEYNVSAPTMPFLRSAPEEQGPEDAAGTDRDQVDDDATSE